MATMKKMVAKKAPKKYATGGVMTTTTETTKPNKYKNLGGEIGRPTGPKTGRAKTTLGSKGVIAKSGMKVAKCKTGCK